MAAFSFRERAGPTPASPGRMARAASIRLQGTSDFIGGGSFPPQGLSMCGRATICEQDRGGVWL